MKNTMTKEEFKQKWDSNDAGGGITFDDIAECAKAWGLYSTPRTRPIYEVCAAVLHAANTTDWIEWHNAWMESRYEN